VMCGCSRAQNLFDRPQVVGGQPPAAARLAGDQFRPVAVVRAAQAGERQGVQPDHHLDPPHDRGPVGHDDQGAARPAASVGLDGRAHPLPRRLGGLDVRLRALPRPSPRREGVRHLPFDLGPGQSLKQPIGTLDEAVVDSRPRHHGAALVHGPDPRGLQLPRDDPRGLPRSRER
jgi:hypothetical protein